MRGQLLGVDRDSGEGQISGDDGQRYGFRRDDWRDDKGPAVGLTVDFVADGARAVQVYRAPADQQVARAERLPARSRRSKVVAALLAFFVGAFGIHRFYLGRGASGLAMLLISLFGFILLGIPTALMGLIALIQSVLLLLMDDEDFARRYP